MNKNHSSKRVGILTFHCSDNFGALLQSYGLLTWLLKENFEAFIVNYTPPFLRGREWFFPYVPNKSCVKQIDILLWGTKRNLGLGLDWWIRKKRMDQFRSTYLTKKSPKIYFIKDLSKVNADLLIVGSDQIWNPNITGGFRKAYFGAFQNDRIQKVIAYGASFGSQSLPLEKETDFYQLLSSVQNISMREKVSADYIKKKLGRNVNHVFDPVFLLKKSEWDSLKEDPKEDSYIFYYETEYCKPLREVAYQLAQKEGLRVIGLSVDKNNWESYPFQNVWTIGPTQFLGYISKAQYVFTNSFHGLALSILFHKSFYGWSHTRVGARNEDLLKSLHLIHRMGTSDYFFDIHQEINWTEVDHLLQIYRKKSMDFLYKSLLDS